MGLEQQLRSSICCCYNLLALLHKSSRDPALKYNISIDALCIHGWRNHLPWVIEIEKLSTMASDPIRCNGKLASRVPTSFSNYDNIWELCKEGRLKEALHLLERIAQQSSEAPKGAFVHLLRGCKRQKALAEGKRVHALIVQMKYDTNIFLSNLLVDMYSNCGGVLDALKVFTTMPCRNVFSWTAMISAYANSGQHKEALALFQQMQKSGIEPNKVVCIVVLKACTSIAALKHGRWLHRLIVKRGFDSNVIVQTSLICMYAKCGCLSASRELFNNMPQRDVISWNAMITAYAQEGLGKESIHLYKQMKHQGYAQKGLGKEALDLYDRMKNEGTEPDDITLSLLLNACASISALEQGKQLHSLILEKGLESEMSIQNTLVDMYAKCGCLRDAQKLFNNMSQRDVVSWNAIIAGYAQKGFGKEALDLYDQMKHEGVEPNNITLALLLKACASILALEQGRQLHDLILEKGFESDMTIQNTLVDMYAKCGCIKDALELFRTLPQRDVVSWNVMIAGYAQKGLGKEALDLYDQMKDEGVEPDNITLTLLLKACASISDLKQGRQLHSLILERSLESEMTIQNTLLDMYAKCGCVKDAHELFNAMHQRDVVSWNAMIAAYAQRGRGKEALDLYEQMKHEGLQANEVTYTCVLAACSHSGLVEEGRHAFESMSKDHGVRPTLEHYGCMVDLLGRAGFLADAEDFIMKMSIQPDEVIWMSLLGAAKKYGNVAIGRRAFEHIVDLKLEKDAAPYLLLIDTYSAVGRMDEVQQLKKEMEDKGLE